MGDTYYVYLSTETICGGQSNYDDLKKDANNNGIQFALLHKDSDLYKKFSCTT